MRTFGLALMAFFAVLLAVPANACRCKMVPTAQRIDDSALIVLVEITQVESLERVVVDQKAGPDDEGQDRSVLVDEGQRASFVAKRRFKTTGALPERLHTKSSFSCGANFEVGVSYLIFADAKGQTDQCVGTTRVDPTDCRRQVWMDAIDRYLRGDRSAAVDYSYDIACPSSDA